MQKWETHLHTIRGSGCGKVSARKIAKVYSKADYKGIIYTNHFNLACFENEYPCKKNNWVKRYVNEFKRLKSFCAVYGIKVLMGLELSLNGQEKRFRRPQYSEILLYGISPEQVLEYGLSLINQSQKSLFELAEKKGWIIVQSHPFRGNVVPLDFSLLHGLEVFNGNPRHDNHNEKAEEMAERFKLIKTSGSDFHQKNDIGCGMYFHDEVRIDTESDFAQALRSHKGELIRR